MEVSVEACRIAEKYYAGMNKILSQYKKENPLAEFELEESKLFELFSEISVKINNTEAVLNEMESQFLDVVDISKFFADFRYVNTAMRVEAVLTKLFTFEKECVLFFDTIRHCVGFEKEITQAINVKKRHAIKLMDALLDFETLAGLSEIWL